MTRALAALLLLPVFAAVVHGVCIAVLDLEFRRLGTEVGFWGRDGYTPSPQVATATARDLESLVASAPQQPDYLALQATSLAWQAYLSDDVDERIAFDNRAMEVQLAAAKRRPAHRHSWIKVVEYASRATSGANVLALAQQRVALLQPAEGSPLPQSGRL